MEKECREIKELHPMVRKMAEELMRCCEKEKIPLGIGETYRTRNRQDELFAQGRTKPGKIVTYAPGNTRSSYHQWRLAFDVFVNQKGKEYDEELLTRIGRLGERVGLEWGGSWTSFVDKCHFQYTGGLSIQDLKQGKNIEEQGKNKIKQIDLYIDDEMRQVEAIEIAGHNYVKLQDLRGKNLSVAYDDGKKCPVIVVGKDK